MNSVGDPVCGMQIDPKPASSKIKYRGITYYFCNQDSMKQFSSYPKRLIKTSKVAKNSSERK